MEKTLKQTTWIGILLVMILAPLLHFTYVWSGKKIFFALFGAVNESTWEHMKLLFMPSFFYFLAEQKCIGRKYPGLLARRTIGLLSGLAFIPICFYTYSGIIGRTFIVADIAIFFFSVFITFISIRRLHRCRILISAFSCMFLLFVLLFCFFLFTFYPPHIGVFLDPVNFTYGI